jgi:tetratricopeptide (TPR) repeat protein
MLEMESAYRLDPLSLAINRDIGTVYFYAGEYKKAETALRKTSEMDYNFSLVHELMGRTYLEMSLYEKALAEFEIEKNYSRSWRPVQEVWIGIAYRKLGKLDKARKIFDKLLEQSRHRHISPYALSLISLIDGNIEESFDWLRKAYKTGDSWLCDLDIEPFFKDMKSDPRFQSLLKDIGLKHH